MTQATIDAELSALASTAVRMRDMWLSLGYPMRAEEAYRRELVQAYKLAYNTTNSVEKSGLLVRSYFRD